MKLRPHHALCLQFFVGRGYSEGFVKNMTERKQFLECADPEVELVCGCDVICWGCPHGLSGSCESAEKVAAYDREVLRLIGLPEGGSLRYSRLCALARENIIRAGRLREVCGSCQWAELCGEIQKK
ncbi:MAG: DUF1284 domain-containing protein [Ruminococcus sp.]|nr:DUF1284 domain-containing protein [Ruminococcus sp.]